MTRDRGEVDILIIGGGMAGLLTALAIAEDGRSVAVIERDHGPAVPEARPGIPQGRFVHQLLARGLQLVGEIVPDAESILRAAGAVPIEWHTEVRWLTAVGWMPRSDSYQLTTLSCSRELLEHVVRVRLRAHPSITLHEGHDVHGLIVRDGVVCGVETAPRGAHSAAVPSRLSARLVIDASGRNGRTLRWLADVGVHEVDEAVVDARLGYASTIVPIVADRLREKALVVHPKAPEHTRSGTIFPLEGGRWIVTLTGINADYPPLDAAGFLEFARSLRSPELHAAIASTPELGTIRGFRNTANRFRHFERLTAWPRGFAVIGDAVCAFNPVYGQGMTVAATTALVVRDWLRSGAAAADSHALQREVARLFQTPWAMSTSTDRSYAGTTYVGDEPSIAPQIARMVAAAVTDASAHHRFLQVMHMLAPLPHP